MSDKEMMLSFALILDQMAEQFDALGEIYPYFPDLSKAILSYRDNFISRCPIKAEDFESYKSMVLREVGDGLE